MKPSSMEQRVAALEADVARLKERLEGATKGDWVEKIWGTFANDPVYEEAMNLGRAYRESLRPRAKKRRK